MNRRFSQRLTGSRGSEEGFTLLELLVCIAILSILAATASQYYLHQRRKAWEAQVRASLRHMAGAENNFVYGEGAPSYTRDLDDLHLVGYRWSDRSVRPYVALATRQTFCIQVHSAHDPSIVWHFSSAAGRPERGPATPSDCGDPEVLGTYIAGLPSASEGRDGRLSILGDGPSTAWNPGTSTSARDGDPSGGGSGNGGDTSHTDAGTSTTTATNGSTPGFGTTDTTSGTTPTETSGTDAGSTGGSSRCTDDGTESGSTTGTNHPSDKDRDVENGGSGSQGSSGSDPDGDENDGADKPGEGGGADTGDQDGNNGSGNDTDFEDDNKGPDRDGTRTPGTAC